MVQDVSGSHPELDLSLRRRSGTCGTPRNRGCSRRDHRTGCAPVLPKRTPVGCANAVVSNHVRSAPILPLVSNVADEIGRLGVARRVQRRAAGRHGERRATERREHAVHLPVVDDGLEHAVVATGALPRQLVGEADLEVVPAVEPGRRPVSVTSRLACSSSASPCHRRRSRSSPCSRCTRP